MEYLMLIFKLILFYIYVNLFYKYINNKGFRQIKLSDVLTLLIIMIYFTIAIKNFNNSLIFTFTPVILLIIINIFNIKYLNAFKSFNNRPVIINKGQVNFKELINNSYNINDLIKELRRKNIMTIEEVDYAVLKYNGRLSILNRK